MGKFILTDNHDLQRDVEADFWKYEDGFVVFVKRARPPSSSGDAKQVFALKAEAVATIEMSR